jgi:hypothetical protein
MNYKSILSSWFGLGLLMAILQYPIQSIFKLIGMAQMQSIAIALTGLASAMLFTYYFYPHIMSPLFKIYAMITTVCISLSIALVIFLALGSHFRQMIHAMFQEIAAMFQGFDARLIGFGILIIFGLLIQFALWYLFITLGNKQMVKIFQTKK